MRICLLGFDARKFRCAKISLFTVSKHLYFNFFFSSEIFIYPETVTDTESGFHYYSSIFLKKIHLYSISLIGMWINIKYIHKICTNGHGVQVSV